MMRVVRSLVAALAVTSSFLQPVATGGPSFNTDRKDLREQSRKAGELLQQSFSLYHGMLAALEADKVSEVQELQQKVLQTLEQALKEYRALEELAPKQRLVLEPRNELDREVLSRLRQRLETRKVSFP